MRLIMRTRMSERTQAIEEEASAWLVRRDSGEWTSVDETSLQNWLNASSLHRVAFWRLEHTWEDAARLKALGAGVLTQLPPPRGEWNLTPFFDCADLRSAAGQQDPLEAAGKSKAPGGGETSRVGEIGRDLATPDLYPVPGTRSRARDAQRILRLAIAATVL